MFFVVSAKVCQTSETQKVYYTLLNIQGRTKVVLNAKNNTKQRKIPKIQKNTKPLTNNMITFYSFSLKLYP